MDSICHRRRYMATIVSGRISKSFVSKVTNLGCFSFLMSTSVIKRAIWLMSPLRNTTICSRYSILPYSDSVLRRTPKFLDLEVLFELLEEQSHLPSILIQIRHLKRRYVRSIVEGNELTLLLVIPFSQIGRKIYVNRADLDAYLRSHRIS